MTWVSYLESARTWIALSAVGSAVLAISACSSENATPRSANNQGDVGAGAASNTGAGNVNAIGTISTGFMPTSNDGAGGTAPRDPRCDAQGNCSCINIGMIGRNGSFGAVPGMDGISALEAWLNANSSAAVQSHLTKPTLTEEFLANYDVIILQALETSTDPMLAGTQWQFSADES